MTHGILQARILEWVAVFSSRESFQPRDRASVSHLLHQQAGSLPLAPPGLFKHTVFLPWFFPPCNLIVEETGPFFWYSLPECLLIITSPQKIPWRRNWQPTPVFLPGEPRGQRSLGGLQCTESQRVKHNWSNLAHTASFSMFLSLHSVFCELVIRSRGLIRLRFSFYFC